MPAAVRGGCVWGGTFHRGGQVRSKMGDRSTRRRNLVSPRDDRPERRPTRAKVMRLDATSQ